MGTESGKFAVSMRSRDSKVTCTVLTGLDGPGVGLRSAREEDVSAGSGGGNCGSDAGRGFGGAKKLVMGVAFFLLAWSAFSLCALLVS
jgi:hypothetical protein